MSKVIKVKSSKNGFSPVKVKVVANEHYIIVDKSGKSFKKLKFIKKDNNLEIYAQQDGKEEQVVVLENYNTPNINASVVSLDSVTNQEISYIYNSSDSWSYINGELSSTELGFAFPLLGLGAAGVGVAVASRGDSSSSSESNTPSATVIDNLTDAEVAGLSDAQLAALTPAQIVAMETAGNLDNLTAAQISKLAPETIAALSDATMAAMATAGKLDNLTNAQVLALPATTIDSVPATVIDNLTDAEVAGLSLAKVQALTSAQLISLGAIGTLDNLSHPVTITQLNGIQPSITLSTASTSLINDYINSIVNGNTTQESTINTQAKIQGLISIVDKIAALAAGGTPALAETDFATIGITGVNASNLATVLSLIPATANDGTGIDTLSEIQRIFDTSSLAGQNMIELGSYGNLIKGVQVEGKWYYYWDRSGDGTSANTQGSSNGTTSSYATDNMTMDWIESTFLGSSTGTVITESNRTFSINGVSVALPTANGGVAYPGSINSYQPGTSYTDAGATTNGTTSTYNDLLAIWDAYNGTTTGTNVSGTPSGWTAGGYLSASPSSYGHAGVNLYNGHVGDGGNNDNLYVALQVL